MVSMDGEHARLPVIQTKFICVSAPVEIGSLIYGWKVAWCMTDQNRVI